uniref:Uncharacterized protein n=1 Tax=Panagrolaimus sp. JU765 TaxID=591449 RepID=A0AC34Q9Q2_9BILA
MKVFVVIIVTILTARIAGSKYGRVNPNDLSNLTTTTTSPETKPTTASPDTKPTTASPDTKPTTA